MASKPESRSLPSTEATKHASGDLEQKQQQQSRRRGGLTSLVPLLRHFAGLDVTVELKNGRSYRGTLVESDDFMNLVLHRASLGGSGRRRNDRKKARYDYHQRSSHVAAAATADPSIVCVSDLRPPDPPETQRRTALDRDRGGGYPLREELEREDFELLHIRGPSVRYVHLPDEADLPRMIREGLDRERAARDKYRRGKRTTRT